MVMKLVLCGDGAVGKTALRHRYMGHGFRSQYLMTIGAEFSLKDLQWEHEGQSGRMKAQIWDLAGQQKFHQVRQLYYTGSHGALLVYDTTHPISFENTVEWLKEIKKTVGRIPVALIGNKVDLRPHVDLSISAKKGQQLAKMIQEYFLDGAFTVPFIETSAKTGENVELAFRELTNIVVSSSMKD